ncbi:unnamed protein product [Nezara viridula]|uniref:Uncharacterized protein n=1 Tax=Nezara viridula TaxID=85310 RepID=A0A9P0MPY6_NEZVI|nr:unnamed protein product [Nezara viridula]
MCSDANRGEGRTSRGGTIEQLQAMRGSSGLLALYCLQQKYLQRALFSSLQWIMEGNLAWRNGKANRSITNNKNAPTP